MRILLAGATGAIGRRLLPLLTAAGHHVTGTTRRADRAEALRAAGATPVVVDVLDADALLGAVERARPDVVIHQLTDLPATLDPATIKAARAGNARVRIEGTRHLVAAAKAAGAGRLIAQSIAFAYAPGPLPHREADPLDLTGEAGRITGEAVLSLEAQVLAAGLAAGLPGLVLRYGRLYGPGTWTEVANGPAPLHVDAAAHAALLALDRGEPGLYNIAEDDGAVAIDKARRQLGFDPAFRLPAGTAC
jgi:nucleoside-diphosphate-sugar epimerase